MITDFKEVSRLLKKSIDLSKVVEEDLGRPTKTSGKDIWWSCPFHQESTPSFAVHNGLQQYNCFGCHERGDILNWTQSFHSITYLEAIQYLASKHNIDISKHIRPPNQEEQLLAKYQTICNKVAEYCSTQMFTNKDILNWYKSDTGFSIDQIATYGVGYSHSTNNLVNYLYKEIQNINTDYISKLELDSNSIWNNTIVYPIKAPNGDTIRFYSKSMVGRDGAKYIGTSHNHPLFTNKLLYGFDVVRKDLRKNHHTVRVVEGFKAAIASGGVAVMGTQLHEPQVEVLRDHKVKKAVIVFDGDSAGRDGSAKVLDYLNITDGINVYIGKLPDDTQPDGLVKTIGKHALDLVFNSAVLPIQYYVDTYRDKSGVLSTEAKFSLVNSLKQHLVNIPNMTMALTVQYLSKTLGIHEDIISSYITELKVAKDTVLYNTDAENCIVQQVLLTPKSWSLLRQNIETYKVFTLSSCQKIYNALDSAYTKAREANNTDGVTVQVIKDELKLLFPHMPDLPAAIDSILIGECKYEFNDALNRVVDLYKRRIGIEQSKTLAAMLQDVSRDTSNILTTFRRQLVTSLDSKKNEICTPVQLVDALATELEIRSQRQSKIIGHDFSQLVDIDGKRYDCLNGLSLSLSGLQDGHLTVLSGSTGGGKSLSALQIAISISVCPAPADQVPVLWIPLEMTPKEIGFRIESMIAGVHNTRLQTGHLNNEEQLRIKKAEDMIARSQLRFKKPKSGNIDEIFSIIDEHQFRYGTRVVFLDYIQLIANGDGEGRSSREQVISRASKVLKNQVAESMGITSFCVSQQNRQNFKAGETGGIEQVSGAYALGMDADDFMIIAAKTPEQIQDSGNTSNRKIFLDKRRGGSSDLMFDLYLDIDKYYNLRFTEMLTPEVKMAIAKGIHF